MKSNGVDWETLNNPENQAKIAEDRALTQLVQMQWVNLDGGSTYLSDQDVPKAVAKAVINMLVDTKQTLGIKLFPANDDNDDVRIRLNGDALRTAYQARVEQHDGTRTMLQNSGLLAKLEKSLFEVEAPAKKAAQPKQPEILAEPTEEWTKRRYNDVIGRIYKSGTTPDGDRTRLTMPLTEPELNRFLSRIPKEFQDKLEILAKPTHTGNHIVSMSTKALNEAAAQYIGTTGGEQSGSGISR